MANSGELCYVVDLLCHAGKRDYSAHMKQLLETVIVKLQLLRAELATSHADDAALSLSPLLEKFLSVASRSPQFVCCCWVWLRRQ